VVAFHLVGSLVMHRSAMAPNDGKGSGGGVGRNGYRREYRQPERNNFVDRGGSGAEPTVSKGSFADQATRVGSQAQTNTSPQAMVETLEKRMSAMQQDFTQALHKISEKENEKFDLIFAILSELQSRQAQLEESVRALKSQYSGSGNTAHVMGNGQMVNGTGPGNVSQPTPQHPQQQQQQQQQQQPQQQQPQQQYGGASNGQQNYGQMGGHIAGQQFAGVMQADNSQAMFTAVPQVVVVSSPAAAGMQYAGPQMVMSPAGAMQPMPPQMAMQFLNQGSQMNGGHVWRRPDEEMGFVGSQDGNTTANSSGQAQMGLRHSSSTTSAGGSLSWNPEALGGATMQDPQMSPADSQAVSVPVSGEASYWGEAAHTTSTPHHQSGGGGAGAASTVAANSGGGSAAVEVAAAAAGAPGQQPNKASSGVSSEFIASVQQQGAAE